MKAYVPRLTHCDCCPGHDTFSSSSYNNNRSKRAQTRDTKLGHRIVRRVAKLMLKKEDNT